MRLTRVLLLSGCLLLAINQSRAQVTSTPTEGLVENPSRWHALTHATVLAEPGVTITDATIIMKDGLIVAVGDELPVPAGAQERDLKGATVLPGLIDPISNLGVPKEWLPPPKPKPGVPRTPAAPRTTATPGAPYWSDFITPERRVAEHFVADTEAAAALRKLGFAAVNAVPQAGVLRGSSAVVNLNDQPNGNAWIVAPDALHVGAFQYRSFPDPGYPTSLMGAIALLRQALYDARWVLEAQAAYARNPALPRAEANEALAALAPVLSGDELLLLVAEDELDYQRAANIAAEFSISIALLGNGYEYRRAEYLAERQLPIVAPLNFPQAPEVERPERALEVTLEALQHWELAPSNGAFLEAAGVPFSFTSAGLEKPTDFWPALRRVVQRGLTADAALAALTTRPAELLGVADRLGTIAPGRVANLAVFSANPLTDTDAELTATWVDGRRFPSEDADQPDPVGTWQVAIPATLTGQLVIVKEKNKLKATLNDGEAFEVKMAGERLLLFPPAPGASAVSAPLRLSAVVVEDSLEGVGQQPDGAIFRLSASRVSPAVDADPDEEEEAEALPSAAVRYPAGAYGVPDLPQQPDDLIVRNATIWTSSDTGVVENADLLVRRGRIRDIGSALKAPRDAVAIDATGKHVTAGIIDAHSHTAISRGVNEIGSAVTVEVRIGDVVDPTDIAIYRELAGGVTAANLLHGSANPIGGQNQVIKLRWGADAESMKLEGATPGVKFALGENPKQSNFGDTFVTRYPQTRMGVREIIEATFEQARDYERTWQTRDRDALPPRRNLRLDGILEILNAERIVHIHSYRQDEILMFARLAADWGIVVGTFQHVLEGYKVADAIAEIGAGGSTFSDWWGYKMEVYDAIPHNTALMHRAGVVTSVNSDSNELARRLNLEAAKAVKYGGLTETEALDTVTINPARQLRIDERTGSLEVGKDADFVIWSGHPLSTYSRAEQTWIDGRRYFDRDADGAAQAWARAERQRLVAKALAARLETNAGKPPQDKAPPDMRGVDTPPPTLLFHNHDQSHRSLYHDGSDGLSCAMEDF